MLKSCKSGHPSLFLLARGVLTRHYCLGAPHLAHSAFIPQREVALPPAVAEGAGMLRRAGTLPKLTLAGCIPQSGR